jgi:trehalose synthase
VRLRDVTVAPRSLAALRSLIGDDRGERLEAAAAASTERLAGRIVWNVNSTAAGGGVAEMLQVLVGYIRGAGIDARWVVLDGDPAFFAITKRIHNRVHGVAGDSGQLGAAEALHYAEVTRANASALLARVRSGDVVLLHDPQTAGMAEVLADAGVKVIWRCHIGADHPNATSQEAWDFLRPHLSACDAFVFSRRAYVPGWVPEERVAVIAPSIDPFSPKNQDIPADALPAFLARMGLTSHPAPQAACFTRSDGARGEVTHPAAVTSEGPLDPERPLVVQVSRWDHLKDMHGVMMGFANRVVVGASDGGAQLALVGPSVEGVADDPEGAEVLAECVASWEALPREARRRIHLVTLPMVDVDENAAMVNALQRSAAIIVQKSLIEGFGLTVAEGMWKGKPVVASRVGGIVDQIAPGTGVLLDDPADLDAYGDALVALLERPEEMERLGDSARRHVLAEFVGDRHLLRYAALIEQLLSE